MEDGDIFPCDMVLLATSDKKAGKASVMTANLDGETNLKSRYAPASTRSTGGFQDLSELLAQIECENPNPDLNQFIGRIRKLQIVAGHGTSAAGA